MMQSTESESESTPPNNDETTTTTNTNTPSMMTWIKEVLSMIKPPEIDEFALATVVFLLCSLGFIFILICVGLMALGWMSSITFGVLMCCGCSGGVFLMGMDPCSYLVTKRRRRRRSKSRKGSSDVNLMTDNTLIEMVQLGGSRISESDRQRRKRKINSRRRRRKHHHPSNHHHVDTKKSASNSSTSDSSIPVVQYADGALSTDSVTSTSSSNSTTTTTTQTDDNVV